MDQVALPPYLGTPTDEIISLVDDRAKLKLRDFCSGPWYVIAKYHSSFGIPSGATDITFKFDKKDAGTDNEKIDFVMNFLVNRGKAPTTLQVDAKMTGDRQMTVHVPIPLFPMKVKCTIWGLWQQSLGGSKPKYYAAVIGTDSKNMVYLLRKGSPKLPDPSFFYDEMCEVARRSGYKPELIFRCRHTQQH